LAFFVAQDEDIRFRLRNYVTFLHGILLANRQKIKVKEKNNSNAMFEIKARY